MTQTKKPAAKPAESKPVTWAKRYYIAEEWWRYDSYDPNQLLLTKTEAETVLSERLEDAGGAWGFEPWDGEEPAVYVLLNNGTFKPVDVELPASKVTIKD